LTYKNHAESHPSGDGGCGLGALLLGSDRDQRPTVLGGDMLLHHVVESSRWTNPHDVTFTDWRSECGLTGRKDTLQPFGDIHDGTRQLLCRGCFGGYSKAPKNA
jgi:hypothetical protein